MDTNSNRNLAVVLFRAPFNFRADALHENKRCAKIKGIKVYTPIDQLQINLSLPGYYKLIPAVCKARFTVILPIMWLH